MPSIRVIPPQPLSLVETGSQIELFSDLKSICKFTIDTHKKNLELKLDAKNTADMVCQGFEIGVLMIGRALAN